MDTLFSKDTIEYILKSIDFLRKVKHIRPRTEKIYISIRKELNAEESSEEPGEKAISETNVETEILIAQKEDENTEIRLGNDGILYERLISNIKSETKFLKNQLLAKDTFFQDGITFLCKQLSEALAKKVDTSAYH